MSDVDYVTLFGEETTAPWHGTKDGYRKHNCRCDDCRKAENDYTKKLKNIRASQITGEEAWHGTRAGFNSRGCRCDRCVRANRIYIASYIYGLPESRVAVLLENPTCPICGVKEPENARWSIDHDHSCCPDGKSCGGCVREVLCSHCNSLIGFAKDDVEILKSAVAYLELHAA